MSDKISLHIWDKLQSFSAQNLKTWDNWIENRNPFVRPHFYQALEDSYCIGDQSGWHPLFFVALKGDELQALIISFVKTHSYGEYIFDWQWAQAYQNYQIPYYPKLTIAVPHSPVSAPKFLGDQEVIKDLLIPQLIHFMSQNQLSGLHFLFTNKEENEVLKSNFKIRSSLQYHWFRDSAQNFEDYLSSLKKNRRKTIKRERARLLEEGLKLEKKTGDNITRDDIQFFYSCYLDTIDKKYSTGYLNLEFFQYFLTLFKDQITLVMAYENGTPLACSLFVCSQDTLYGRYWGCKKEIEFLHFELCIYQGIEITIEKGLNIFEAGAQGEHKRMRGFTPVITTSAHYIDHPEFRKAIYHFIDQEDQELREIQKELSEVNSLKTKIRVD